jgi:hypothetical protein
MWRVREGGQDEGRSAQVRCWRCYNAHHSLYLAHRIASRNPSAQIIERVLHALLHDKLGRLVDDDGEVIDDAVAAFTRLEDPLTASVFSRLRYLPTADWWAILRAALAQDLASAWPPPPPGPARWRFWPSLDPADGGLNLTRVEPDVLVLFEDAVVIFEVKHRTRQSGVQWREQILAATHTYGALRVVFVAVGGLVPEAFDAERQVVAAGPTVTLFGVTWPALRDAIGDAMREASDERALLLGDVRDSIVRWGYRPLVSMGSLVSARKRLAGPLNSTIPRWSTCARAFGALTTVAARNPMRTARPLAQWNPNARS